MSMDHFRSNLSGYYTQQYTPVPLPPTYPPPTAFSNPSPYARDQPHHGIAQNHDFHHDFVHSPLAQAPIISQLPAADQAPPAQSFAENDLTGNANAANKTAKKRAQNNATPKGFGRTSAVYQIDGDGTKRRVVAEDFRAEVEERTRNGESCEQIADALIAQGAQVTSKSISRWRILWGFRKRAVRKQSKPPKPKEERVNKKRIHQSRYRSDITRMSQQGLQAEEIARIMTARGMALKKGGSTIARLQTVWRLRGDEESRIKNKRYLSRRKAREQQIEEFQNYAKDLGLENPDEWIAKKLEEPAVKQMRHNAACELMGDDAAALRSLGARGRPRKLTRSALQSANDAQSSAAQAMDHLEGPSDDETSGADVPLTTEQHDSDVESSDGNSDYDTMDGVGQNQNHIMDLDEGNSYQPLVVQDDDDDEDDENSNAHQTSAVLQDPNLAPHVAAGPPGATIAVVLPAAEQESMNKLMGTADGCIVAAQLLKDLLQARSEGRPAPRSLTGLPPSSKDIEMARHQFREVAQLAVACLQVPN